MTYNDRASTGMGPRKGGSRFVASQVKGVAVHWNGPPVGAGASRGERDAVRSYLRGIQRFHQVDRGWSDVAYNFAVDNAGNVWELRGLDYRSAANGDTVPNQQYVAILCVIGQGQKPTPAMYDGLRTTVKRIRAKYPKATLIKTHNQVRPHPTECPGPDVSAAIRRGDLEPGKAPKPKPDPVKPPEDDMPITDADAEKIAKETWRYDQGGKKAQAWGYLQRAAASAATVAALEKAIDTLAAAVRSDAPIDVALLAAQVKSAARAGADEALADSVIVQGDVHISPAATP